MSYFSSSGKAGFHAGTGRLGRSGPTNGGTRNLLPVDGDQENVARMPATTTPRFRPVAAAGSAGARRASGRCST